ncbi:MAG: riboflavin synthase subunit alpha [Lentisphaerae bacterium GWF2_44_16]|nr:MAG: riboflavin synthase subunit alpha [Lentisphaerae bacterium GWF2_44_16]
MFTGLVETTGKIRARNISGGAGVFKISTEKPLGKLVPGESIAVNGACLTLEHGEGNGRTLVFHVLEETLKRTNLGLLPLSSPVNIERAMSLGDRIGGHIVSGHIDAVAPIRDFRKKRADWELAVQLPQEISHWLVEKGSIAVDGISLTLVELTEDFFTVHIIPTTLEGTALKFRKKGEMVNLEADIIGKYVHRQLFSANYIKERKTVVDMDLLRKAGW